MKAVIIGANGQLGNDICQEFRSISKPEFTRLIEAKEVLARSIEKIRECSKDSVLVAKVSETITDVSKNLDVQIFELVSENMVPLTHAEIEITDMNSVKQAFEKHQPDVIINTAAFHRVDDCESNQDKAFLINALGAKNVAVVAQELRAKLVHISTDYVFGGENEPRIIPYTEFDVPAPPGVYGKSKLAGEHFVQNLCSRHFIVRVSGLFGVAGPSGKGSNFIETILRLVKEQDELRVVSDQIFSPTYTKDLAKKIRQLITTEYYGIFHITNRGSCSWYEFTKEILKLAGFKTPVVPITSDQLHQKARRPHYSVLDNYHLRLLGIDDMRLWQEALKDYMKEKGHLK